MSCNCACSICLSGYCCMDPNRQQPSGTWPTVTTSTTYGWACTSSGHDFMPFNGGTIFCRKCGTFRALVLDPQP